MVIAGCGNNTTKTPAIDTTNFDPTIKPGDNFYQYATGGWQTRNPLKPEYARYGSFDVLRDNNEKRLNELFKDMGKHKYAYGTVEQKISDLYQMGLDSTKLNNDGAAPLRPYIEEVLTITDSESLARVLATVHRNGENPFYGLFVMADMMDSNTNIGYLNQSGLGMGDRDYYLDTLNAELKAGYKNFLEKVIGLAGIANPESVAGDALAVEDALAAVSWSRVEMRDTWKSYNPMTFAQIMKAYPALHLDLYLEALGVPEQEKFIVRQPSYFEALNTILDTTPVVQLRNYVLACIVKGACNSLSDDFYAASFDFFSKQMAGIEEQKPRWRRAMSVPDNILSEAVGQMYVERYFSAKDKKRMTELVANIQTALGQHIEALDWMSDATKAKALEKLANFTVKIGYPDTWKDYSSLEINPEISYYDNIVRAENWYKDDNLADLGKPVDKAEWLMSPQTVNAYYNPTTNEICFPAAILQPPFYNPDADDAVNYGAIGVVISHEMTHGFDDQGRNFDKDGNLVDWWTPEDDAAFRAKADVLVKQFDEVEVLPGVHANGALCLGENIADHGGLRIAYSAMQNSFGDNKPGPKDGFTPEQRFYLAYATLWAQNITDEEIARLTKLDVHSIGCNRVNVSLRNLDTFFEAFDIKDGDSMYRPESERVVIW